MINRINLNFDNERLTFIENSNISDFINFAKEYNIFQQSNSKVYDEICLKIKNRLESEGLSYETVRPD